jgi:predicted ATP-dependent Lon-type protease
MKRALMRINQFSFCSQLDARDAKAVRKTIFGLIKLICPHGEVTIKEMAELMGAGVRGTLQGERAAEKDGCPSSTIRPHFDTSIAIQRAFAYINGHKGNMGIAHAFETTDFHVESINLLNNHISCDAGVSLVVAIYSSLMKQPVLPGLLVLGDLSIQGNIKAVRSLAEPLQMGMDNGARCALIPIENKRHFLEVSADIVERVDPVFYSDPLTAARKALGLK